MERLLRHLELRRVLSMLSFSSAWSSWRERWPWLQSFWPCFADLSVEVLTASFALHVLSESEPNLLQCMLPLNDERQ